MKDDSTAGLLGAAAAILGWGKLAAAKLGFTLGSAATREVQDWVNLVTAIGAMAGTWIAVVIAVRKLKSKRDSG